MAHRLERAELYLCLARSFLLPTGEEVFEALQESLAEDLQALCGLAGCRVDEPLADYRRAIASIRTADELSLVYSTLFLAPPRRVHLNSSVYIGGMLGGASVAAMEQCYRRCGVERSENFRNLSDHVSVQLEFVAWLYASEAPEMAAEHFLDAFVRHWLPRFLSDLASASASVRANPYLGLAQVLQAAVEHDAVPLPRDPREERRQRALERARATRAARGVTDDDLKEIERRLKARGLSTAHLPLS